MFEHVENSHAIQAQESSTSETVPGCSDLLRLQSFHVWQPLQEHGDDLREPLENAVKVGTLHTRGHLNNKNELISNRGKESADRKV